MTALYCWEQRPSGGNSVRRYADATPQCKCCAGASLECSGACAAWFRWRDIIANGSAINLYRRSSGAPATPLGVLLTVTLVSARLVSQ
jgi:hypothetical protein